MTGEVITERTFRKANAFSKGWMCYLFGKREDQPHVPDTYEYEREKQREMYAAGQRAAVLAVQDEP